MSKAARDVEFVSLFKCNFYNFHLDNLLLCISFTCIIFTTILCFYILAVMSVDLFYGKFPIL